MTQQVIRQDWLESERGWGFRPDGYSLHLTEEDRKSYIKAYWDRMPDQVPDEYSRPSGDPETFTPTPKQFAELATQKWVQLSLVTQVSETGLDTTDKKGNIMSAFVPKRNNVMNQAIQFATTAHGSQVRKGNEHIPYIFHPIDVANEVIYYSGLPVEELEIASVVAILHDTVEDTIVTGADIREQFGDQIAEGVAALSKDDSIKEKDDISKVAGIKENLERLQVAPVYVQCVKLADRTSNLKAFPAMWSREKISSYLDEAKLIADTLGQASEGLHARLLGRIAETRMVLSIAK